MNPYDLILDIAKKHGIDSKWTNSKFESIKHLGNTSKGQIGESFILAYCKELDFIVSGEGNRLGTHDLLINKKKVEVKTATEDVTGSFQFNHLRLDYKYDFVICLGISPNELLFGIYTKSDLAIGNAGNLVSMGAGQNSSFKLTKRYDALKPIHQLKQELNIIMV